MLVVCTRVSIRPLENDETKRNKKKRRESECDSLFDHQLPIDRSAVTVRPKAVMQSLPDCYYGFVAGAAATATTTTGASWQHSNHPSIGAVSCVPKTMGSSD